MKKYILITGCAGFIGYHLCNKLKNKFNIVGVDNLNNYYDKKLKLKRLELISKDINFIELDLTRPSDLKNRLKLYKFDTVIHLAAQAGVRYSYINPKSYIQSNILATFNLLDYLKKNFIEHFIFASSSSVYGDVGKFKKISEHHDTNNPISLYAATKKSCENLIFDTSLNYNIPSSILRFFTVYGPWGRPDMAIFKFFNALLSDQPIDVYNNGNLWRDFTYIDDIVRSISLIMNLAPNDKNRAKKDTLHQLAPYRILNVGNQSPVKLLSFIESIEKIVGKKFKKNFLEMQKGDVLYTHADISLLKSLTGFKPKFSIDKGLENFFKWYKNYYNKNL